LVESESAEYTYRSDVSLFLSWFFKFLRRKKFNKNGFCCREKNLQKMWYSFGIVSKVFVVCPICQVTTQIMLQQISLCFFALDLSYRKTKIAIFNSLYIDLFFAISNFSVQSPELHCSKFDNATNGFAMLDCYLCICLNKILSDCLSLLIVYEKN
jgi:hypothetical protein